MSAAQARQRLIRLIHVAKRELHMDDDTYRLVLRSAGDGDSAAALTVPKLEAVLEHFKKAGFKVRPKARPARGALPLADDPEAKKIRALWLFLHKLGAVKDPSERALFAYVKRMTGVDALQWVDGRQSLRVIETLKKWAQRYLPEALKSIAAQVHSSCASPAQRERSQAALSVAAARGSFDSMWQAYEVCESVLLHNKAEEL